MRILSKGPALGIALLACYTGLYAQNFEKSPAFAFNDNLQADFLSYKTSKAESQETATGFQSITVKTVPISIKVRDTVPSDLSKEYFITDDGSFQYCYPDEKQLPGSKKGFKPITMRTFYLEAFRKGIIPPDISYSTFTQLSIAKQQDLLNDNRVHPETEVVESTEAGMITYKTSPNGLQVFLSIGEKQMELLPRSRNSDFITEDVQIKYLSKPRSIPLMVKVLTDPFDKVGIPGQADFNTWSKALKQLANVNQQ